MLRTSFIIAGAALVFVGAIWFLQGVNLLPGSFMTGQTRWATNGALAAFGGALILIANWRR